MPFNWQTFKTRTLSAVFFVILMLVGLLWNHWSFFILFSVIHFGCWVEYQKLVEKIDPEYATISPLHKYGVMIAGWGFMLWMTNEAYWTNGFDPSKAGFWLLVAGAIAVNIETIIKRRGKLIAHSLMGLIYISLSFGLMISLRNINDHFEGFKKLDDFGYNIPIAVIISMWINDTMAYIVGSLIGKTPFSKISPKKTWEGTIGGIMLCIVVVGLIMSNISFDTVVYPFPDLFSPISSYHWYIIAAIAAIFGTLGDLFESKLKRLAGVKDSGHMMPGHGGFLDRFDSLLVAVPFVWLYIKFFL